MNMLADTYLNHFPSCFVHKHIILAVLQFAFFLKYKQELIGLYDCKV